MWRWPEKKLLTSYVVLWTVASNLCWQVSLLCYYTHTQSMFFFSSKQKNKCWLPNIELSTFIQYVPAHSHVRCEVQNQLGWIDTDRWRRFVSTSWRPSSVPETYMPGRSGHSTRSSIYFTISWGYNALTWWWYIWIWLCECCWTVFGLYDFITYLWNLGEDIYH